MLFQTGGLSHEVELSSGDGFSLYRFVRGRPSSESKEISEGVVLDYDLDGRLVGIDIDNASNKVELKKLILNQLPGTVESISPLT